MAGRWKEVALQPVPGDRNGGYTRHMPDYAPRAEDYDWIARELGDVPHTTPAERLAANGFPALAALAVMFDYAGETLRMRD